MITSLEEIESEKRAYKDEIRYIRDNISDYPNLNNYLNKWLNSEDIRLQISACSIIDEIGEIYPDRMLEFKDRLLEIASSDNLQLAWRAFAGLESFAQLITDQIYENLPTVLKMMDADSIVGRDHAHKILAKLSLNEKFREESIDLMFEMIISAPENQSGQYAERTLKTFNAIGKDKLSQERLSELKEIMLVRLNNYTNHHHIRRMNKLITDLEKLS
jgi:radical SAM superfamily enzyme YgiQ (UPF0313 family)